MMALQTSIPESQNGLPRGQPAPNGPDASITLPPTGVLAFRGALDEDQQEKGNECLSGLADKLLVDPQDESESPLNLPDFDWAAFQSRFDQVIHEADQNDIAIIKKFESLVEYFGVWATASADFDEDRSIKRIKTREAYVQNSEQAVAKKREQYEQVVAAFQRALALLGPT